MKAFALLVLVVTTAITIAYCEGHFDKHPKVHHKCSSDNDFEILRDFDRGSGYSMFNGVFGF